jgi:hypothetical protein
MTKINVFFRKVKFIVEQATKAQRSCNLYLTLALDGGG